MEHTATLTQPTTTAGRARHTAARLLGVLAPHWPLLLIVLAGLALRIWLLSVNTLDPRFSNADDGDYYRRALRLAVTGQYLDDSWLIRPPLHVWFFALWLRVALLLGQPQLGVAFAQAAQLAVGVLTVPLGWAVARRLFASARAGLLFAGFLALWFPFVEQPTVLFSELLYLFLFLLHLWLLLRYDAARRPRDLALSGLALGAAALTRSPALYSLAFVALWLLLQPQTKDEGRRTKDEGDENASLSQFSILNFQFRRVALFAGACLLVVLPWTARNYLVYQRLIPIDTLGQINLWLDLDAVGQRTAHIETLRRMPQADRAGYALAQARAILAEDPLRPFRNMWPTFQHIWKAQFVEDLFVKQSLFGRPLRQAAALGLLGDLLWLVFTVAGIAGLAGPVREGLHSRLFFLAWVAYSLITVLVFHVEPRYLLPIWTLLALYGAGTLARLWTNDERRTTNDEVGVDAKLSSAQQRSTAPSLYRSIALPLHRSTALPLLLVLAFFGLVLSYRDYPAIISVGLARERAVRAAEQSYQAGDYAAAERSYRAALEAQPGFADARAGLALALLAQGRADEAAAALGRPVTRQGQVVAGAVARAQGRSDEAAALLSEVEPIGGEDMQRWAARWLRAPAPPTLRVGDGQDLGYIAGFSGAERGPDGGYRWLEGQGQISLPLAAPLRPGARLELRMAGGQDPATPLELRLGGSAPAQVQVARGGWRVYRLPIPDAQLGRGVLSLELRAPTFVPARSLPGSDDARALSLMLSEVRLADGQLDK
jgi:4-amino-4-deoxy-L-arabinose transferase-like glycosyltransferase